MEGIKLVDMYKMQNRINRMKEWSIKEYKKKNLKMVWCNFDNLKNLSNRKMWVGGFRL